MNRLTEVRQEKKGNLEDDELFELYEIRVANLEQVFHQTWFELWQLFCLQFSRDKFLAICS
jgi:hypothetical protein